MKPRYYEVKVGRSIHVEATLPEYVTGGDYIGILIKDFERVLAHLKSQKKESSKGEGKVPV